MTDDIVRLLLNGINEANLQLPSPSLVNYYHDFNNRCLWLDCEIDEDSLDIVQAIIRWNQDDQGIDVAARKPIKIFFHSPGGGLDVAEILTSVIKLSKTPVYGIALGMVASAASIVYLGCHKRFALSNAYFVLHRGSYEGLGGSYNEVQAAMEDYKLQIARMEKFYIENTTYPEEVIKSKIQTDWYIHCDEAMKYEIVTDLIENIDILL